MLTHVVLLDPSNEAVSATSRPDVIDGLFEVGEAREHRHANQEVNPFGDSIPCRRTPHQVFPRPSVSRQSILDLGGNVRSDETGQTSGVASSKVVLDVGLHEEDLLVSQSDETNDDVVNASYEDCIGSVGGVICPWKRVVGSIWHRFWLGVSVEGILVNDEAVQGFGFEVILSTKGYI